MDLKCIIAAVIGGSIMYFILHGACPFKKWLKRKKDIIDKNLKG
jgi:hypothetical protein